MRNVVIVKFISVRKILYIFELLEGLFGAGAIIVADQCGGFGCRATAGSALMSRAVSANKKYTFLGAEEFGDLTGNYVGDFI